VSLDSIFFEPNSNPLLHLAVSNQDRTSLSLLGYPDLMVIDCCDNKTINTNDTIKLIKTSPVIMRGLTNWYTINTEITLLFMSPKTPKIIFLWRAVTPTLFHRTYDTP